MLLEMKRWLFFVVVMALCTMPCVAQTDEDLRAIALAVGAAGVEDMDEYELERLTHLLEHPVRINMEGPEKLVAAGVLTRYQAVSLADYRSRHGDVLSLAELSLVDGFTSALVEILRPFISLDSFRGAALTYSDKAKYEAVMRASARAGHIDKDYSYSAKLRVGYGDCLSGNLSLSRSYGSGTVSPEIRSFNLYGNLPGIGLELFLGDFNARFGQGLVMWNGMSMSGVSSPSASRKNAHGLSATWSFSGSSALTGAAARWTSEHWEASAAVSLPGVKDIGWANIGNNYLPMLNVTWYGRNGQCSVTHITEFDEVLTGNMHIPDMKTSADMQVCIRGVNAYGEAAYDWVNRTFAALAGTDWGTGESGRLGVHLRYYPSEYSSSWSSAVRSSTKCSNEYGISFSGESRDGMFSVDAAYYPVPKIKEASSNLQMKAQVRWMPSVGDYLKFDLRLVERWRSWGIPFRTDIRSDVSLFLCGWTLSSRLNVLKCSEYGFLMYLEESWKHEDFSIYMRQGAFRIDKWDDRIYVYERDAPGSFNVPAFYGRGVWASMYAGWRFWRHGRMYLRMFYVTYPFMTGENEKPGKAELRLQFTFSL